MSLFARMTEMHLKAAPLLDYISCGQVLKLLLLDCLCVPFCSVVKIACTWRGFTDKNKPHEVKLIDVESRKQSIHLQDITLCTVSHPSHPQIENCINM